MRRPGLIQISTPAQASATTHGSGSVKENAPVEVFSGALGQKIQKKDKPGIFAKLLENLTGKAKKGASEAGGLKVEELKADGLKLQALKLKNPVKGEGGAGPEKTGKSKPSADTTAKKTQNSGKDSITSTDKVISAALSGLLKQNQLQPETAAQKTAGTGAENTLSASVPKVRKDGKELAAIKRDSLVSPGAGRKPDAGKEGTAALNAGKGGDNRTAGIPISLSDKGIPENLKSAGKIQGADKSKKTQTAGTGAPSAKDSGSTTVQSQAVLRSFSGLTGNAAGKVAEGQGKKGREKPKIEIRDLRSAGAKEAEKLDASNTTVSSSGRPVHTEIELPVNLSFPLGKGSEGAAEKAGKDAFQSSSFEDALAGELRGDLSTDIVRDASVIVRNGGEGTIRLSLHPESLGDVKIRLEMTENKISGHIIVQSSEALRAFERELPVLEKAFRDSGFSETNLDMSLAQDTSNFGGREQRREGDFQTLTPVQAASRYDSGSGEPESFGRVEVSPLPPGMISSGSAGRKAVNLFI